VIRRARQREHRDETLAVRSRVTAGGVRFNHSEALAVRTDVRAGSAVVPIGVNHSQALARTGGPRA
jgi:hypothetical protein